MNPDKPFHLDQAYARHIPVQNVTESGSVNCCCIIPCFNESKGIGYVLDSLTGLESIDEFICVNDDSKDNTADIIQRQYPKVKLLHIPNNTGKASAVLFGLKETKCEYILLADGDLQNIIPEEFNQAIQAMKSDPLLDMVILRRVKKDLTTRFFRGDLLITGERVMKRSDLIYVFTKSYVQGFQLEVAINRYMHKEHKTVRWIPVSSVGMLSFRKMGFYKGLRKEITMLSEIISYLGLPNYLQLVLFFGRQRM